MLGLEHIASRGSIMVEYYGRNVGVKIMPTGVDPDRFRQGLDWANTKWRRGELVSQVSTITSTLLCVYLRCTSSDCF